MLSHTESRHFWLGIVAHAILLAVRINRRTLVTVPVCIAVVVVAAVVFRKQLQSAAEATAQAAADEARAVLLKRDDRQLQDAFASTRAALAETKAITLYHVANEFDEDYASFAKRSRIAGYPVRQQTVLRRADVGRLNALLTTRSTYLSAGDAWLCIFEPRHVLQIEAPRETITIVICIHCGDVEFVIGKDSIGTRSLYPKPNGELSRILQGHLNSGQERIAGTPAT